MRPCVGEECCLVTFHISGSVCYEVCLTVIFVDIYSISCMGVGCNPSRGLIFCWNALLTTCLKQLVLGGTVVSVQHVAIYEISECRRITVIARSPVKGVRIVKVILAVYHMVYSHFYWSHRRFSPSK